MGKLGIEHKHTHRVPHSKISISGKSQTHLGDNPGASSRPLLHIVADLITLKPSLTDGWLIPALNISSAYGSIACLGSLLCHQTVPRVFPDLFLLAVPCCTSRPLCLSPVCPNHWEKWIPITSVVFLYGFASSDYISLQTTFPLNESIPASLIFTFMLTLSKPIIFVALPGASFNPLYLWGWAETALIQLPASYLCHVQSWKVEDQLYFLLLAWIPPALSSWKILLRAEKDTHMHVSTDPHAYFIFFVSFYFIYYIDWYKILV